MKSLGLYVFLAAVMACSAEARAPIPDAAVDQAWSEFESVWHELRAGTAKGSDLLAAYNEHIEPLPFERMTSRQLASLDRMAFQFGSGMGRSIERLNVILEDDPDDLHAMIRLADLLVWAKPLGYAEPVDASSARIVPMLDRILAHSELSAAVDDGTAALLPMLFGRYGDDDAGLESQRSAYETLLGFIAAPPSSGGRVAVEIGSRWQAVKGVGFDAARLGQHRDALLPLIQSELAIAQAETDPSLESINTIHRAEQALGMLNSNASTRDFVGSRAPELSIEWSSDAAIGSLSDLRGKVVLLNFWVTGCGHCIAAIPRLRELAGHYRGTDVVIVGVTSIQGRHFQPGADGPVTTSGDPGREHELMRGLMDAQHITWPVVFTRESAWNPAYEVRGTPHLTLIGPNGVVVNNDLHPQDGLGQISEHIDGVLTEFGLARPTNDD